jgi:hypothetical protein
MHINLNSFQKMRVKFAEFSNIMASIIRTCVTTNELVISETALATAHFVDSMNRLFDCLNSSSLYSKNIYNCVLLFCRHVQVV